VWQWNGLFVALDTMAMWHVDIRTLSVNSCTWLVALWQSINAEDGACRNRALNVAGPVQGVENHNIFAIVIQMHLHHGCITR
jgi:hypothetical protein